MGSKRAFRPVVLCVLDGWGHRPETDDNAIALAETPVWDRLTEECAWSLLATSGAAVGLPEGQMGNSEVGHMTIGAGRVIPQDLPRIDAAVAEAAVADATEADSSLARNPALLSLVRRLRDSGGRCHLMGLVSPGGVHAHQDHIAALAQIVGGEGVPVRVHAFLDGRDVPPRSALDDLSALRGRRSATCPTSASRPWPAATTPWTGTGAGREPRRPATHWSRRAAGRRKARRPVSARAMRKVSATSSSSPPRSAATKAWRTATG